MEEIREDIQAIASLEAEPQDIEATFMVLLVSLALDNIWSAEFAKLLIVIIEELNAGLSNLKGYVKEEVSEIFVNSA